MNTLVADQVAPFIAVIEQAGIPALRAAFTIAVLIFLYGGILIFRRRHQLFDRDPNVEDDVPVVRHNRLEEILFVWGGLTLVLISILYQVWSE
jgi:cbb3-type cytochrome oxidase subunit 3